VQNEPKASQTWESCYYEAADEALLIKKHLVPAFKKAGLKTKIIVWDHNKERVYDRARDVLKDPAVRDAVWGIGFHWYSGDHFDAVSLTHHAFPEKVLLETEFCKGLDTKGDFLNDFSHAMDYGLEMLGNLNNHAAASVDWNMLLDMAGGPYHNRDGGCIAPVMVDLKKDTIHLLPSYYAIAHFSRFIKRGARRIGTSSYSDRLKLTAFKNPDGKLAAVIINTAEQALPAKLRLGNQTAGIEVPARSLMTCVLR
jgi:glucosylceramidase